MTLIERIKELDRLYLKHDRLLKAADDAGNQRKPKLAAAIRRRARAAWREYVKLRDSACGMEEKKAGAK